MIKLFNAGKLVIFRRGKILFALIVVVSMLLIYRLVDIQILQYEKYRSTSNRQLTYEVQIGANRGTISDCNMKKLAVSSTVEQPITFSFSSPSKSMLSGTM